MAVRASIITVAKMKIQYSKNPHIRVFVPCLGAGDSAPSGDALSLPFSSTPLYYIKKPFIEKLGALGANAIVPRG